MFQQVHQNLKKLLEVVKNLKYQVTVKIAILGNISGKVDLYRDIIYIDVDVLDNFNELACTFFHEYAHITNKYNKKYTAYHNIFEKENFTFEDFQKFKRVMYRAELYTDKVAAILMKEIFPTIEYHSIYSQEWVKDFYRFELRKSFQNAVESYSIFIAYVRLIKEKEDNIIDSDVIL